MTLTEPEMIEILEDLARNGGATARVTAIKLLREMGADKPAADGGFDELDEVAAKRNYRTKAT